MLFDRTKKVISILFPVCILLLVLVVFGSFVMTALSSPDSPLTNSPIPTIESRQITEAHVRHGVATDRYTFFIVEDHELWRTNQDGTEFSLVKSDCCHDLNRFKDFVLATIVTYDGIEIWRSDGTETGTYLVKEILTDIRYAPYKTFISDNAVYFLMYDSGRDNFGLMGTDGSARGTRLVKEFKDVEWPTIYLNPSDGNLFISVADRVHGKELWISDGTEIGTQLLKDINPGGASSSPYFLLDMNGIVYFSANDGEHGWELWATDGTETGTMMIKDIQIGAAGSVPWKVEKLEDQFFFSADDGQHGQELWVTDGTTSGTHLVKDINQGLLNFRPPYYSRGTNEVVVGKNLFFFADDGIHGLEMWVSDGSNLGTHLVKDIYPGPDSAVFLYSLDHSLEKGFIALDSHIYFQADDGIHGRECWRSDGTEEGTYLLKDINPDGDAGCQVLQTINSVFLFVANNGQENQVWASNGTTTDTIPVDNDNPNGYLLDYLHPYPAPADPEIISFYGEGSYSSYDPLGGPLWALYRRDIEHLFLPTMLNQVDALKVPGEIIFISDRDAGQYQVFNMTDLNTKSLRRVTEDAYTYGDPSCSSDGRIVVNAGLGNRDGIYLLDYATGVPTRVGDDNLVGEEPVWSPDNTRFAFSREGNLFTIGVDGTNQQQLTATTAHDIDPDWSPDGSQLAFASDRSGTLQLYVMDVASQQSQALLPTWHNVKEPAWSPDGKQIAFYSDADGDNEIYVLQLETGAVTQLTDNNAHDRTPLWSPDGQWILFTSERDGNNEFYVTTPTGDKVTRLTDDPSFDWGGCWYQQP